MRQLVIALAALFFSTVLFAGGNAFVTSLLGVRLSLAQVEPLVIGAVLFFYSLGFVLGTHYCQPIIRRVGHIRAFAVFAAVLAIAALCYPLSDSMLLWALLRLVGGLSAAGVLIVIESWFSCAATESNRGTLFATYQIGFYSAVACGQLLLGLVPALSPVPFSVAAMLITAALIPLALSRMQSPVMEEVEALPFAQVFRSAPLGIVATLINGILMSGFFAMGPVYATLSGLSLPQTALFMAAAVFVAMLLAWPVGHFCDRHDRARVLLVVCVAAALASAGAQWLKPLGFAMHTAFAACYVGLTCSVYAISLALTNDRLARHQIVAASATLLLSYGVGSLIGPLLFAVLIRSAGPEIYFAACTALLLGLGGYVLRDLRRVPALAPEQQEDFVATVPELLPAMVELDPRNEDFDENANTLAEAFAEADAADRSA